MIEPEKIIKGFANVFSKKKVISISGASGTGKTSLTMYLIGHLLTLSNDSSCIWIQGSELFPIKRLDKFFQYDEERHNYILENLHITPKNRICLSLQEQYEIIDKISNNKIYLPPFLKFIVIDNISHQLRARLSEEQDTKTKILVLNTFFRRQLLPLILFCENNSINLIFIHENTYNPKLDRESNFLNRVYSKIDSIDIVLKSIFNSYERQMEISSKDSSLGFIFDIIDSGILWHKKIIVK